uniref:Uncharacterized protein n=1 Tax=Calcidiscus leptoporus TaxID=127549 RepID=A0A7S0NTH0_9EUKA|mmetsp:Transcript_26004/g.60699  ORF Transcript_26004/g.60699 Transcript_26004/m.60699 type:complete len:192 (+) Transcript_26004:103-678(+)
MSSAVRSIPSILLLVFATGWAARLQPRRAASRGHTCRMCSKGGLPPGIADRLSFQTGGYKQANQAEESLILWDLFKGCYPSEEAAIAAVNKNSLVLNPSMNSPSKITGTYQLLLDRFGPEGATNIITKNPGILSCVASSVAQQSDADILRAAEFVVAVEENKELVKLAIFGLGFAFFNLIGYRIGTVQGWF